MTSLAKEFGLSNARVAQIVERMDEITDAALRQTTRRVTDEHMYGVWFSFDHESSDGWERFRPRMYLTAREKCDLRKSPSDQSLATDLLAAMSGPAPEVKVLSPREKLVSVVHKTLSCLAALGGEVIPSRAETMRQYQEQVGKCVRCDHELKIDDTTGSVRLRSDGAFVRCWIWVPKPVIG